MTAPHRHDSLTARHRRLALPGRVSRRCVSMGLVTLAMLWVCPACNAQLPAAQLPAGVAESVPVADPLSAPSVIVVCPSRFRAAIAPWLDYRESQGVTVRVIDSQPTAAALTDSIRQHATASDQFLILIGDTPVIGSTADPAFQVPMHYVATTVSAKFGSTPTMATDYPYADVDGDGKSDLAVGRLPVDTPPQLAAMIGRIRAYESSVDFSRWRHRIQLVGGIGGFGMLADAAIESVTRMMVTASLPAEVRTSVAYGSPGHLFYPRERFTDSVSNRYSQGCRFWVYAGHGMVDRLDQVPRGPTGMPVLDNNSLRNLKCDPATAPIAVLLCCFTGAIDASVDSFAEQMLLHECGPIAVIAGNRVTMPYGNASLTMGLIDSIYGQGFRTAAPAERLGEAWLDAITRLEIDPAEDRSQLRTMIDAIATLVSPAGTKLADERSEHAALYGLLGDPLLKLHPPSKVVVETATGFDFGQPIDVTVNSPIDGQCVVMLDHPLGEQRRAVPGQPFIDPNEITLTQQTGPVQSDQPKTFSLSLPESRTGLISIRVHIAGQRTWASGAGQTFVRPAN
ncbi:C25 family cysteine peptidase [Stieleria sp. TO1_6]|uniref:C25 family cysteine peptidase n=1 Tax=Stieleria tagensis TaxID=2956795 RepID=UPI00209A8308|nr:C25 family cysteine peptidase [Stieleria tagensis]MCO8122082.1 C25 family cysteine peptidase [Stieleria tagensis]